MRTSRWSTWSWRPAGIATTVPSRVRPIWVKTRRPSWSNWPHHTVEGLNLTLDAIKPGMRAEEVELIWRTHIAKVGLEKESRIGYAMGLNYPPDWGEHTASLRPGDQTILAPNMTFHMILGMWMDDYGFECSESFRVSEDGCETFADVPRKLFVKG